MTQRESWMTDDQWECAQMFADVVGGFHHITGSIKPFGSGIKVSAYTSRWATFDFDGLTRIVILAHDRMIRVALEPSGPRMIGFTLWKRHTRDGGISDRHPTMDQAIATLRRVKPVDTTPTLAAARAVGPQGPWPKAPEGARVSPPSYEMHPFSVAYVFGAGWGLYRQLPASGASAKVSHHDSAQDALDAMVAAVEAAR